MSSKDLMMGGGTAVALLGVIVYNQYKFGKLQEQIDELRGECQTLAKYVQLLEARLASELRGGGHHHPVQGANPGDAQMTPYSQEGHAQPRQPQSPAPHSQLPPSHPPAHNHPSHPVSASRHPVQPAQRPTPVRHPAGTTREVVPPASATRRQMPSAEEAEGDSEGEDSPPVSNRRESRPPPRAQPASRAHPRTQAPRQQREEEEDEKKDSERRERAPVRIAKRNPSSATRGTEAVETSESEKPKKRFVGKGDDDEDQPLVSARRAGPKSILRNPEQPSSGNRASSSRRQAASGSRNPAEPQDGAPKENIDDDDVLGDIESIAKSSKREDNEGREPNNTATKARMDRTRAIAAAMQKKREEKLASSSADGAR